MQDLNRDVANICISPRPSATLGGKVPLHIFKNFENQARQNICTLKFSAAFNQVLSECNLIMGNCRDSIKAIVKWGKSQIQKGADPERAMRFACDKTGLFGDP